MQREQNLIRQLCFAIRINERHREARHAYITIHLAVKTGQPQNSLYCIPIKNCSEMQGKGNAIFKRKCGVIQSAKFVVMIPDFSSLRTSHFSSLISTSAFLPAAGLGFSASYILPLVCLFF